MARWLACLWFASWRSGGSSFFVSVPFIHRKYSAKAGRTRVARCTCQK